MITKPEKRLTANEVLNHPWMKENLKAKAPNGLKFISLKAFTQHHTLKKIVLTLIAS